MEAKQCPSCGKSTVILGHVLTGQEGDSGGGFVPLHSRMFRYGESVLLDSAEFSACVSCGHLWSRIDPSKVREFVQKWGQEISKQQLDEIDHGPYRDLPDTDLAHEIGDQIAELDALVRQGKTGYIGRYRELRGVIWDQAISETRRWPHLTRKEKLALFGWEEKKKPALDDLDEPLL